ncbi:MAG: A/G-specific adenine glycosylase [Blautia sp.]|jgi:A/G-specific adenine glycosylase
MTEEEILISMIKPLLSWYDKEKRTLPWRDQGNAYYTWVSEIMLQQTRVEAVKPYFLRFMKELPTIESLAHCPEKKLMKLWEGLGYYNRVRNMQQAALQVVEEYGGKLPADYDKLLTLKGIGSYTAGAIASIAYGVPVPAVDGNVLRVISRILESDADILKQSVKSRMEQLLKSVMPKDRPGDYNQALMELGAVICIPNGMAKCEACPAGALCLARAHGRVEELPKKAPKKPRKIQERTVLIIQDGERLAIRRRPAGGLLAGLYEPPNLSGYLTEEEVLEKVKEMGLVPLRIRPLGDAKHIFSHIEWRMKGYQVRVEALEQKKKGKLIFADPLVSSSQYAIPSAYDAYAKYWKEKQDS